MGPERALILLALLAYCRGSESLRLALLGHLLRGDEFVSFRAAAEIAGTDRKRVSRHEHQFHAAMQNSRNRYAPAARRPTPEQWGEAFRAAAIVGYCRGDEPFERAMLMASGLWDRASARSSVRAIAAKTGVGRERLRRAKADFDARLPGWICEARLGGDATHPVGLSDDCVQAGGLAEAFGVSVRTVHLWRRAGCPHELYRGTAWFTPDAVRRWRAERVAA